MFARYNVFGGDAAGNLAAFETIQAYTLAWPQLMVLNRTAMTDANNRASDPVRGNSSTLWLKAATAAGSIAASQQQDQHDRSNQ